VYHKPAATFIGKGRLGAEEMAKRQTEYVFSILGKNMADILVLKTMYREKKHYKQ
jgi:hypothetical protein